MDIKRSIVLILFLSLLLFPFQISYAAEKDAGSSAQLSIKSTEIPYDKRIIILKEYLNKYNSPLVDSAETFVKSADIYQIDWRLLVAISGVESTFGHEIPYNSYNAWGWGIYGDNMVYFKSFDEGIETISKALRENYINSWKASNIYELGRYYAASPTWAQRVDSLMNKIEKFAQQKSSTSLSISL